MKINVKHIDNEDISLPNGCIIFNIPNTICTLQLGSVNYIDVNIKEDKLYCPDLEHHGILKGELNTDEITINIDGWFHIFYDLTMEYLSENIIRIKCEHKSKIEGIK